MPAAEPPHVAGGRREAAAGSDALPSRAELGWVPAASPRFPKPGHTHASLVPKGAWERLKGPSQDLGGTNPLSTGGGGMHRHEGMVMAGCALAKHHLR